MKEPKQSKYSFYGLGIAPSILEALDRMRFAVPTPIQHKAIPIGIEGKDLIGVAQTGTGKTLAFAIPIIQRLSRLKGRCLVITPTRELALQVKETFGKLALLFGIRTVAIIGGVPMTPQLKALKKNPRVIIATPGRLIDHIHQRTVRLSDVDILVLDEADRMLDMGFLPDIKRIIKYISRKRQTMLFSATIPGDVVEIAASYMKMPIHVEIAPSGTAADNIIQEVFIVKKASKNQLLAKLLDHYHGPILLFSRTKRGARKLNKYLRGLGYTSAEIHSDRTLTQRREALEGFKKGKYEILVATDIAARGIDVIGIELVINYDLPDDSEQYVHRIGRTGRAGYEGRAISFATPEQGKDVRSIERIIKTRLPISEHPHLPRERFISYSKHQSKRNHRRKPSFYNKRRKKREIRVG